MRELFADSYFYIALLNDQDGAHRAAIELAGLPAIRLVTTEFVLVELADALCTPSWRVRSARFIDQVRASRFTLTVPIGRQLLEDGLELYRERRDKYWSLTDCTSFVVMRERGIAEALTADQHFEQAGFKPLLKRPV